MDKTIEIIVVAMVAIATAVGLMFMVRGQSDSFLNFADGETSSAKCKLAETKYETAMDRGDYEELSEIQEKYSDCELGSGGTGGSSQRGPDCDTVDNPERFAKCSGTGIAF